jgi:hypothetical protein
MEAAFTVNPFKNAKRTLNLNLKIEYLTQKKPSQVNKMKIESRAVIINTFSVSSSLNPSESALAAILAEVLVGVSAFVSFTYTNISSSLFALHLGGKSLFGTLESKVPYF